MGALLPAGGLASASISSFTSEASAEAADGRQLPVSSGAPAAASGTCISPRTDFIIPPALNADSTGTLITGAPPPVIGATITGLDGRGASSAARSATSLTGTQSEKPARQHSESGPISP